VTASAGSSASPDTVGWSGFVSPAALAEKDGVTAGETYQTIEATFRI
jgi:hypothetical protein